MRAITNIITRSKKYIKIYTHFWKVGLSLATMYRTDTLMLLFGVILMLAVNITFFWLIFGTTPEIGGWNIYEMILLFGVYHVNWGILKLFYGRTMENVIEKVFNGQYDFYLLKPISSRFIAYTLPPNFKGIPSTTASIIFFFVGFSNVDVTVTAQNILVLVGYCLLGQLAAFSFLQLAVSSSFLSGRSEEVFGVIENAWLYAGYPGNVFTGKVFALLTYIVPITIFASYPTALFLGKIDFSFKNLLIPVVVALGSFLISNAFYKFGVKNYTSASS